MALLTLRTSDEQDSKINELKQYLGIKSASKVLMFILEDYRGLVAEKDSLIAELNRTKQQLNDTRQAIAGYKDAQTTLFKLV